VTVRWQLYEYLAARPLRPDKDKEKR
jgi:hypothetical protein